MELIGLYRNRFKGREILMIHHLSPSVIWFLLEKTPIQNFFFVVTTKNLLYLFSYFVQVHLAYICDKFFISEFLINTITTFNL